jgi:hypothetical protein
MSGEVYLAEDARGWLAIHESRHGDSSGVEGPFSSYAAAVAAAKDMAERFGAPFKVASLSDVLVSSAQKHWRDGQ